jgi:hypothetical protein
MLEAEKLRNKNYWDAVKKKRHLMWVTVVCYNEKLKAYKQWSG